jgi:cell division protein FtsW
MIACNRQGRSMSKTFSRTDNSLLSRWWWSVDRWVLLTIFTLVSLGLFLTFAASPAVAERLHLNPFYFVHRHALYLMVFWTVAIGTSLFSPGNLKKGALLLYVVCLGLLILTPLIGQEIKGAKRWLSLGFFSLQPSEFMKPVLIILCAWMLSEGKRNPQVPGQIFSLILFGLAGGLLLLQPDMGMLVLMTSTLFIQFFIAGLPLIYVTIAGVLGSFSLVGAYFLFPHVQERIHRFLFTDESDKFADRYQIHQSLEAFANGGLWGQGPGEGLVKKHLPDAHADFIFAVAGEEFGVMVCLGIITLFGVFLFRSMLKILQEKNLFIMLTLSGCVFQIALQASINMASTMDLIPTKGMTLPFISFGGSSMLSAALMTGVILSLTRRRFSTQGRF